jgi:ferrochelatase
MAFGGPTSAKDVGPFLQRFLGREVPGQRLHEVKHRYQLIGGSSPHTEITLRQARCLEDTLTASDPRFKVYVGMRHWYPLIAEAIGEILRDGIRRVIALPLSPYRSKMSTVPYILALQEAMASVKGELEISIIEGWNTHPLFLRALAEKLQEGLLQFPAEVRDRITIVFSAHSLPTRAIIGDPYVEEIEETISGVIAITGPRPWQLAFQSGGVGGGEWLGPEVRTVLRELERNGQREILVVPVGFVSDNVETLYDIDILYRQEAESMGLVFQRSPSLNDSDTFIEALSHIVHEHLATGAWSTHPQMEVES